MTERLEASHFVIRAKGPLIFDDIAPDLSRMRDGYLGLARADERSEKLIWVRSLGDLDPGQLGIFRISLLPDLLGVLKRHPVLELAEPKFCPIAIDTPFDEIELRVLNS